jgi:hypothetical protein
LEIGKEKAMQGFFFNIRSGGVKQFSELFQPEPRNKRARIRLEIGTAARQFSL